MTGFESHFIDVYGDEGKQWLDRLPEQINAITERYQLSQLKRADYMNYNYLMTGYQDETPIMLKLSMFTHLINNEITCLTAYQNRGAIKLLAHEPGMILMERAQPGTMLKDHYAHDDEQTITIYCDCAQQLHAAPIPEQHTLTTLPNMLATLDQDLAIPSHLRTQAQQLRDQLLASNRNQSVLLHGDLHHENIIKSDTGWVAIDPRGIIGEPLFDVCAFIYNPIDELLRQDNVAHIIDQRIEAFVIKLGCSRQRIFDWLYVRTVWVWMEWLKLKQDSAEAKQFITILESLARK